jgi:hypothetical protein
MSTYEKLTYLKLLFIANEKRLNKPDDFNNNLISITPNDRFSTHVGACSVSLVGKIQSAEWDKLT